MHISTRSHQQEAPISALFSALTLCQCSLQLCADRTVMSYLRCSAAALLHCSLQLPQQGEEQLARIWRDDQPALGWGGGLLPMANTLANQLGWKLEVNPQVWRECLGVNAAVWKCCHKWVSAPVWMLWHQLNLFRDKWLVQRECDSVRRPANCMHTLRNHENTKNKFGMVLDNALVHSPVQSVASCVP